MKKKTLLILVDRIFWAIILLFPLLAYLVMPLGYSIGGGSESVTALPSFTTFITQFGIFTGNGNIVFTVFDSMLGSRGVLPLFTNSSTAYGIIYYLTYFVSMEIVHLLVDFLVFIPRLSHKWLSYLTRADEVD